ncbi:hypothetical protein PVMG_06057 [Plasmodium vivax Mauritania I]|uniref:Uncharacterized protein n=1 Tax=Plasmodium vivax Mauritania I TaxID=1035515 RepID=A0A0J9T3W3_PLAVI|nr:hypothetical protein PVMG_06057 [Plasmodium vivax Mauritania I]
MAEKDDDIYFLPSVANYRHIDTHYYYLLGDTDKCEDLERDLNKDFEGVEDFCMRTTGILNNFDKLNFNTDIDKDKCEIVNYWVYNYLFNRIKKKDKRDPFEILARILIFRKEILESSEGGDKTEKCVIREELNDKNNFKKMKILFDYITDYKTIKLNIDKDDFACSTPYKNYINKGVSTYNSVKAECKIEGDKPNYCDLLSNSNINHNHEKLADLKCLREKSTDASPPRARLSDIEDLDPHPPGPGIDQLALQGHTEEHSSRTMQHHTSYGADVSARDQPFSSPLKDDYQISTAEGESPPPPKGAFMTTVFPTIGSLFFFSMIYKVNKNNLSKYKNIYC